MCRVLRCVCHVPCCFACRPGVPYVRVSVYADAYIKQQNWMLLCGTFGENVQWTTGVGLCPTVYGVSNSSTCGGGIVPCARGLLSSPLSQSSRGRF